MADPLDEIGDLVGKTLNILGDFGPTPPAPALSPQGPPSRSTSSRTPQVDEDVDLLHTSQVVAAPLQTGHSVFQEESLEIEPQEGPQAGLALPAVGAGAANGAGSQTLAGTRTQSSADKPWPLRVSIKEPEKVEAQNALGLKTHFVQYVVRTDSAVRGMLADGLEVKRRFSDFDALHKHLHFEFRGYFVPPLPEKAFLQHKMAQDDFIRLRRADLQAFITGLAKHPVLRESEALKVFLLQPGELVRNPAWTYLVAPSPSLKQQQRAVSPHAGGLEESFLGVAGVVGLKAWLGSGVSWMKQNVAQLVPPKRDVPEDERLLRQQKELLSDLERLLELAVEAARGLCGRQEAMCGDMHELGRTFAMLSRYEEAVQTKVGQYTAQGSSAAARASDLGRAAYGSARQSPVWKTLSIKTASSLVALHDYCMLVPEAVAALAARENALTTLHLLQDELVAKTHAHEAAQVASNRPRLPPVDGVPSATSLADKKVLQLGQFVAQLEEQVIGAQAEYTLLKERNQSELTRLNLERESDFRRMLANFATTQAQLGAASAEMWATLAQEYDDDVHSHV